jgi:hypothetical protein
MDGSSKNKDISEIRKGGSYRDLGKASVVGAEVVDINLGDRVKVAGLKEGKVTKRSTVQG